MVMRELCASSCPCSPPQESVFSPYPPLPSLEDLREPPPPCSDSLSPPQLFPSSYSPSSSPFTCTSTSHSFPPHTPDSQLPGAGFYHLQLGSYLQDDLPSGSDCGQGSVPVSSRMEVDFSMPPVLPLMPPTPGPPSPSASVTAEFGVLGGFPLPLCHAPVQHPRSLTQ